MTRDKDGESSGADVAAAGSPTDEGAEGAPEALSIDVDFEEDEDAVVEISPDAVAAADDGGEVLDDEDLLVADESGPIDIGEEAPQPPPGPLAFFELTPD